MININRKNTVFFAENTKKNNHKEISNQLR